MASHNDASGTARSCVLAPKDAQLGERSKLPVPRDSERSARSVLILFGWYFAKNHHLPLPWFRIAAISALLGMFTGAALGGCVQLLIAASDRAKGVVAESQVDLAKTIATVKGLPRNAAMSLPATASSANDASTDSDEDDNDDDDDDDDDDEIQSAPTNPYDLLMGR